jgi:hypothetical protein
MHNRHVNMNLNGRRLSLIIKHVLLSTVMISISSCPWQGATILRHGL